MVLIIALTIISIFGLVRMILNDTEEKANKPPIISEINRAVFSLKMEIEELNSKLSNSTKKMKTARDIDSFFHEFNRYNDLSERLRACAFKREANCLPKNMRAALDNVIEQLPCVLEVKQELIRGCFKKQYAQCLNDIENGTNSADAFRESIMAHSIDYDEKTMEIAEYLIKELKKYEEISGTIAEADSLDGHQFEYWCSDLLEKLGFDDVEVTPGSKDQGVDVLAKKDGIKYAIQCKCYSSDLGNTPIQEVNTGKAIYRCQIGVVMTNRYFTQGAKDAAEATGVLLWDRDWIQDALERIRDK